MNTPGIARRGRVRAAGNRWLWPVVAAAALSIVAWLLLAGQVQAATEAPQATGSGDTTLLLAGLAGAALAAVWLLKPSRPRSPRPPDEPTETTVAHARPADRDRKDD